VVEAKFERSGWISNLHLRGGRMIPTMQEHPFFEKAKGWTPAGELVEGDEIRTDNGWMIVEEVFHTGVYETVYNIRVADFHTYFVGEEGWDEAVWAHNQYGTLERASTAVLVRNVEATSGQTVPTGYSVHHLIPVSVAAPPQYLIMVAARCAGYDINNGHNLVALPNTKEAQAADGTLLPLHSGGHLGDYFDEIARRMRHLQDRYDAAILSGLSWTNEKILSQIRLTEDGIRRDLLNRKKPLKLQNDDPYKTN